MSACVKRVPRHRGTTFCRFFCVLCADDRQSSGLTFVRPLCVPKPKVRRPHPLHQTDNVRRLAWLDNAGPGVVVFNTDSGTPTLYSNVSERWDASFGYLMADQQTGNLYWYTRDSNNSNPGRVAATMLRFNTATLQEANVTSIFENHQDLTYSEVFMDSFSNQNASRLVFIKPPYTFELQSLVSVPLNGDPIIRTPISGGRLANCMDFESLSRNSQRFLTFADFVPPPSTLSLSDSPTEHEIPSLNPFASTPTSFATTAGFSLTMFSIICSSYLW